MHDDDGAEHPMANDDSAAVRWSFVAALFPLSMYAIAIIEMTSARGLWPHWNPDAFYGIYLLGLPLGLIGGFYSLMIGIGIVERRPIVLLWMLAIVLPPALGVGYVIWMVLNPT